MAASRPSLDRPSSGSSDRHALDVPAHQASAALDAPGARGTVIEPMTPSDRPPPHRSLRQSVQVRASKRAFRHRLIMRTPARCDRGRVRRTREVRGPTPINVGSGHRRGTRRAPRRTHATSRDHISGTWVHACGGLWPASAASSRRRCRSGCSGTGRWARFRRPLDEACHAVVAVWGELTEP
jgi:hypothetical protein